MTPNQIAKKYLKTTKLLAKLEKQKAELREALMTNGEFETDSYSLKIIHIESEYVESLKDIEDKSPKLFDALHKLGCVRIKKQTRVNVKAL